jgi:hypothetical protein
MDPNSFDVTQVFGVRKPMTTKEEIFHRELERRSLDIIRVKNPDQADFFVEWDKRYWKVPAQATLDVPRYIAIKYCKDKAVDTVNKLTDKMHIKDMEERSAKGLPAFESKWQEAQATYEQPRYPKTNDKELLSKLYSVYWVGLVYEYGKDTPVQYQNQAEAELDMTPIELKIIAELENRRVDLGKETPVQVQEPSPFKGFTETPVTTKEELAKEVTVDEPAKDSQTTG